jgi:hypothetical protein
MSSNKLAPLDRLKAQLLQTGTQRSNNPLYQVIDQLIGVVRQNASDITALQNAEAGINLTTTVIMIPGMGGDEGYEDTADPMPFVGTSILDGTHNGGLVQRIP